MTPAKLLEAFSPQSQVDEPKMFRGVFSNFSMFEGEAYLELLRLPQVREHTTLIRKDKAGSFETHFMRHCADFFQGSMLAQKLQEGSTLAIRFEDVPEQLVDICKAIDLASGQSGAKAVLVISASNSDITAWDPQPFLIVQVQGSTTWRLSPPVIDVSCLDTAEHEFVKRAYGMFYAPGELERARSSNRASLVNLQVADGLFVPVGWSHERVRTNGLSVHFVFQPPGPAFAKSFCD